MGKVLAIGVSTTPVTSSTLDLVGSGKRVRIRKTAAGVQGLTILGVVPQLASLAGGAIIAAAAIYIARREAQVSKRALVAESKTFPKT